jgi:hypothetical protein
MSCAQRWAAPACSRGGSTVSSTVSNGRWHPPSGLRSSHGAPLRLLANLRECTAACAAVLGGAAARGEGSQQQQDTAQAQRALLPLEVVRHLRTVVARGGGGGGEGEGVGAEQVS